MNEEALGTMLAIRELARWQGTRLSKQETGFILLYSEALKLKGGVECDEGISGKIS